MSVEDVLNRLRELGNEKTRAMHRKNGAGENVIGVKMGDLRAVARSIGTNTAFARELWTTGNLEARLLATLVVRPKELAPEELRTMVAEATFPWLADWLNGYVVKLHPAKEELRREWLAAEDPMLARSGWSLTAERVRKDPDGLDLPALLDRIEREMGDAPREAQWTMNGCLAEIGIAFPEYRDRAIAIGEKLGVFRDYPVSKGCTSPFAPIWIREIAGRKESPQA